MYYLNMKYRKPCTICKKETPWSLDVDPVCPECVEELAVLTTPEGGGHSFVKACELLAQIKAPKKSENAENPVTEEAFNDSDVSLLKSYRILLDKVE